MFTIMIRTLITFVLLVILMRLMGKRQLGEMQPFELVITLVIAEVACIPMSDPSIPLVYGIVPILVLFVLHWCISLISRKSIKFRRFVDGANVVVIDGDGINYQALKNLNMNINDLLEATMSAGYYDLSAIQCAFFQTNGKLAVIPYVYAAQPTCGDLQIVKAQETFAMPFIVDGKVLNLKKLSMTEDALDSFLKEFDIQSIKEVVVATIDDNGKVYIQQKKGKYISKIIPSLVGSKQG